MSDPRSEHETARLAAILTEHSSDQLAKVVETIDSQIEHHLKPVKMSLNKVEQDMSTLKTVLKDTNKDTKSLDTAMGNVKHRVHNLTTIITDNYLKNVTTDRKLLHSLDKRIGVLEKAYA